MKNMDIKLYNTILLLYDATDNNYTGFMDQEWINYICSETGMTEPEYLNIMDINNPSSYVKSEDTDIMNTEPKFTATVKISSDRRASQSTLIDIESIITLHGNDANTLISNICSDEYMMNIINNEDDDILSSADKYYITAVITSSESNIKYSIDTHIINPDSENTKIHIK